MDIVLPIGLYTRITDHDWLEVKSSIPKISICNIKNRVIYWYTVIHYNLYPKLGIIICIKSLKALSNFKSLFLFSQTTGYFQQTNITCSGRLLISSLMYYGTYMMASVPGLSLGEVHPSISPGDKGLDWGMITSYLSFSSWLAAFVKYISISYI